MTEHSDTPAGVEALTRVAIQGGGFDYGTGGFTFLRIGEKIYPKADILSALEQARTLSTRVAELEAEKARLIEALIGGPMDQECYVTLGRFGWLDAFFVDFRELCESNDEFRKAWRDGDSDATFEAEREVAAMIRDLKPILTDLNRAALSTLNTGSNQPHRRHERVEGDGLCGDCPPVGYPTDKTRCSPCPRNIAIGECGIGICEAASLRTEPKEAEGESLTYADAMRLAGPAPNRHCDECSCGECLAYDATVQGIIVGWDAARRQAIVETDRRVREECARIVDDHGTSWGLAYRSMTDNIASSIRSTGDTSDDR